MADEAQSVLPHAIRRRLTALPEERLRRALLREALPALDDASLALFLAHLVSEVHDPEVRAVYLDVVLVLLETDGLPPERADRVVARLREPDPVAIVSALVRSADDARPPAASSRPLYEFEELPLGVRKARARLPDRDLLRRLLSDPDPSVIAVLADNPRATEADLLVVASRRPQTKGTFGVILASRRFGMRPAIHSALVQNPWCPVRIAIACLPLASAAVRREIAASSRADPRLREAARYAQ
jgi:hypothetical protein